MVAIGRGGGRPTAPGARFGMRRLLPAAEDLRAMGRSPRRDLTAGLTVAVVALPLALGFGVSSGLGAAAGLATAVVAGVLAALFGGSATQVSGPTGAMTVVIVPIVAVHGPSGVLTVGLMAGLILLAMAVLGVGRLMRYVPASVVEGFTFGIACVIALQQFPLALGVHADGERVLAVAGNAVAAFAATPHWPEIGVAAAVAVLALVGARLRPGVPFSLVGVVLATVVALVAPLDVRLIGALPAGLPAPSLAFLDPSTLGALLPAAAAVAALAALESLLSAQVADGLSVGDRHDPDRELVGQGLANLVAPLFGGVPATGAIARTAVNVRAGATSRLAALSHAVLLAGVVYLAAWTVALVPVAALAGVLLATAVRMVDVRSLWSMARATRADAAVLVLTAVATVAVDLIWAIGIGLLTAGVLALRAVARQARLEQVGLADDLPPGDAEREHALLAQHIVAFRLDGPLFFAAAHRFLVELPGIVDVAVVILRLSHVTTVDASGALALRDAIAALERRGVVVYVSGVRDGHHRPFDALDVLTRLRAEGRVFGTTPQAIAAARERLQADGVLAGPA